MTDNVHKALIPPGVRWLRSVHPDVCRVITEVPTRRGERPDIWAIERARCVVSYVIEVKVSVPDFNADRTKTWRRDGNGMGNYRWYLTPRGLLDDRCLPDGWGLIEVNAKGEAYEERTASMMNCDRDAEMRMLLSVGTGTEIMRRQNIGNFAPIITAITECGGSAQAIDFRGVCSQSELTAFRRAVDCGRVDGVVYIKATSRYALENKTK